VLDHRGDQPVDRLRTLLRLHRLRSGRQPLSRLSRGLLGESPPLDRQQRVTARQHRDRIVVILGVQPLEVLDLRFVGVLGKRYRFGEREGRAMLDGIGDRAGRVGDAELAERLSDRVSALYRVAAHRGGPPQQPGDQRAGTPRVTRLRVLDDRLGQSVSRLRRDPRHLEHTPRIRRDLLGRAIAERACDPCDHRFWRSRGGEPGHKPS
jgi:hypothetical protein